MMYETSGALMGKTTAPPAPNLNSVAKRSAENLAVAVALLARLSMAADHLSGPVPTDGVAKAADRAPASSAVDVLSRGSEDLATVLYGIRCQIDRLEMALGVNFAPPEVERAPGLPSIRTGRALGASIGATEDPRMYRGLAPE